MILWIRFNPACKPDKQLSLVRALVVSQHRISVAPVELIKVSRLWRSRPHSSVPAGSRVKQRTTVKLFTQTSLCLLTLLKQNSKNIEFQAFWPGKRQHHLTLKRWYVVIFPTEGIPQEWSYGRSYHSLLIMAVSNHVRVTTLSRKQEPASIPFEPGVNITVLSCGHFSISDF